MIVKNNTVEKVLKDSFKRHIKRDSNHRLMMENDSDDDNLSENPLATGGASIAELIMLEEVPQESEHIDDVELVGEFMNIEGVPEVMEIEAAQVAAPDDMMEGNNENIEAVQNQIVTEEIIINDEPEEVEIVNDNAASAGGGDSISVNNAASRGSDDDAIYHDVVSEDENDGAANDNAASYSDDEDVIEIDYDYDPETIANVILEQLSDNWNKARELHCGGKNYFDKWHQEQNFDPLRKKFIRIGGYDVKVAIGRDNTVHHMPIKRVDELGFLTMRSEGRQSEHSSYISFLKIANHRFEVARLQATPPEQDGDLFKRSFSKLPHVQQLIDLTIDATKLVEQFDTTGIRGMNVKEGTKMLSEFTDILVDIRNDIIPTTTENMNQAIRNMALLTISSSDTVPHKLEYFRGGRGPLLTAEGPACSGMSQESCRLVIAGWLNLYLVPLLTRWSSDLTKKLPEALKPLAVYVGVDFEGYMVTKEQRGRCQKCGKQAKDCGIQPTYLMHFKVGTGTLFVALNGMTKEEFVASDLKPTINPAIIPRGSSCIPWTQCEAKEKASMCAAFEVITTLFFDETSSNTIGVGFDVENAERKNFREMVKIMMNREVGFRIVESSAAKAGSFPNYALQKYLYRTSDGSKIRTGGGIQADWTVGRRVCSDLYKMPRIQGTFSLKGVAEDPEDLLHRDTLLYICYNRMDSSMCWNMMLIATITVLMECPILVAGGFKRYIHEVIQMVLEATARRTTKQNTPWKTDVVMPIAPNRILTPVKDLADSHAGTDQLSRFAAGAFSQLGVSPLASFVTQPEWSTTLISSDTSTRSEPLITIGKNKANKLNKFANNLDSSEVLEECSTGVSIKMNKDLHASLEPFEISDVPSEPSEDLAPLEISDTPSESTSSFVPTESSDVPSEQAACNSPRKRTGEEASAVRRAEEPRNKKQAVEDDTTGEVVEHRSEDLEKIKEILPMSHEIVDEMVRKKDLTQEEVKVITDKVQAIVDDATVEVVVRVSKTSKEAVLRRVEIAEKKEEAAIWKKDYEDNSAELKKLLAKQIELREKMKKANRDVAKLQKVEFDKRKDERANAEKKHEDAKQEIITAGAKLITEAQKRTKEFRLNPEAANVTLEAPQIVKDAPISQRVTKELSNVVPAKLEPWREEFIEYCHQRYSYMKLVLTIIKILEKAREIIEEFDRERAKTKYRSGNFLGVAKLKNAKVKTRAKNEISWVNGRKLVSIIRKLAEFHLDPKEVDEDEEILETDDGPERVRKTRSNANKNAQRLIKDLAGQISPVCAEVTGEELRPPWPNPLIDEGPSDKLFSDMAKGIWESQDPRWRHVKSFEQGRIFLEIQVQEFILPSKYPNADDMEVVEEEDVEERVPVEDQGGSNGHFIMDEDIPDEMNDVGVIIPQGRDSVSIIRKV